MFDTPAHRYYSRQQYIPLALRIKGPPMMNPIPGNRKGNRKTREATEAMKRKKTERKNEQRNKLKKKINTKRIRQQQKQRFPVSLNAKTLDNLYDL